MRIILLFLIISILKGGIFRSWLAKKQPEEAPGGRM